MAETTHGEGDQLEPSSVALMVPAPIPAHTFVDAVPVPLELVGLFPQPTLNATHKRN